MNLNNLFKEMKKRWLSTLLCGLLIIFIFNPDAKSWVLQQLVSTGLFKAEIKKGDMNKSLQEAATFSFTDSLGNTVAISELKGKVLFINFWASWCPPCRAEMPSLEELYKKLKDDNRFVFLFINEDEDRNKAIRYFEKNNFTMPLYYRVGQVSDEIFSGTLPTTVVINKEGKVVLKHEGMAKYNTETFIRELKELL